MRVMQFLHSYQLKSPVYILTHTVCMNVSLTTSSISATGRFDRTDRSTFWTFGTFGTFGTAGARRGSWTSWALGTRAADSITTTSGRAWRQFSITRPPLCIAQVTKQDTNKEQYQNSGSLHLRCDEYILAV